MILASRLGLLGFLTAVLTAMPAASQIVIRKSAEDNNPPLFIRSIDAPPNVDKMLRDTLRRCDWFRLVSRPGEDAYVFQAKYNAGTPASLEVRLSKGAQQTAAFRVAVGPKGERWTVFTAVDKIIEKAFASPGPCRSRVAFTMAKDRAKEIFTCNFDGSEMKRMTHNRSISTEPSWGPGGTSLVYTLYRGKSTQIVQVDPTKGMQRRIAAFPGLNAGAAVSPDGRSIALCLSRDKQVDLYIMTIADGGLQRLTRDIAVESSPTWSPDGKRICYVSDRAGGRPQLYLIAVAGGRPEKLLTDFEETVSPDWSPVSNRICFATRAGGQYAIAAVDMASSPRKKEILTSAAGDFEAPSWGPDGRHLVCSHTTRGGRELCMVDSWTQRIIPVTQPGLISLPSWTGVK